MFKSSKTLESNEIVTSIVDLDFSRHAHKEAVKGKPDEKVRLTEEGRLYSKAKATDGDISQSMAFGGPKERSQETAGLMMAGLKDEITGMESLEELKAN